MIEETQIFIIFEEIKAMKRIRMIILSTLLSLLFCFYAGASAVPGGPYTPAEARGDAKAQDYIGKWDCIYLDLITDILPVSDLGVDLSFEIKDDTLSLKSDSLGIQAPELTYEIENGTIRFATEHNSFTVQALADGNLAVNMKTDTGDILTYYALPVPEEETPVEEAPAEETPAGETPAEETPADGTSGEQTSGEQTSAEEGASTGSESPEATGAVQEAGTEQQAAAEGEGTSLPGAGGAEESFFEDISSGAGNQQESSPEAKENEAGVQQESSPEAKVNEGGTQGESGFPDTTNDAGIGDAGAPQEDQSLTDGDTLPEETRETVLNTAPSGEGTVQNTAPSGEGTAQNAVPSDAETGEGDQSVSTAETGTEGSKEANSAGEKEAKPAEVPEVEGIDADETLWTVWTAPTKGLSMFPFTMAMQKAGFSIGAPDDPASPYKFVSFIDNASGMPVENMQFYYSDENQKLLYMGLATSDKTVFESEEFRKYCAMILMAYNSHLEGREAVFNLPMERAEEIVDYAMDYADHCLAESMRFTVTRSDADNYYSFQIEY